MFYINFINYRIRIRNSARNLIWIRIRIRNFFWIRYSPTTNTITYTITGNTYTYFTNELEDIACRLDDSVQTACSCRGKRNEKLSERFCELSARNSVQMMSRELAFCVMFTSQEMFCAPTFL